MKESTSKLTTLIYCVNDLEHTDALYSHDLLNDIHLEEFDDVFKFLDANMIEPDPDVVSRIIELSASRTE